MKSSILLNKAGIRVIAAIIAIIMSVVLIVTLAGCGAGCVGDDGPGEEGEGEGEVITEAPDCDAGDAAFVESSTLSILGRRPLSRDETALGVDRIAELEAATPGEGRRLWALELMGTPGFVGRWSELLMDDLYVPRTGIQAMGACWGESNFASTSDPASGETALAEYVLDHTAPEGDFGEEFTFRDLLQQSVLIDDVSPAYRAHLYAMLTRLNGCNNVDFVQQELAFRDEVGHTFEAAYLNRDPVCLACHTTSFAVTDDEDPAIDRHWPLKGRFEDSVFGEAGVEDPREVRAIFRVDGFVLGGGFGPPETLGGDIAFCADAAQEKTEAFCGGGQPLCADGSGADCLSPLDSPRCEDGDARCDDTPYCADAAYLTFENVICNGTQPGCADESMFFACGNFNIVPECQGGVAVCPPAFFASDGAFFTPWGADPVCGSFARDLDVDDPAEIDARFATVSGQRATVIELEASLKRGIDSLAAANGSAGGLVVDDTGAIADPDQAFAYLVAMNIVDNTWKEIVGAPLTIATHFPRNQAQRDQLQVLTDRFVASHFSLKSLVADIVTSDFSNIQAPEAACGAAGSAGGVDDDAAAFSYPPIYDPWVRDEPEAARRNNSAADAVHALSARTLLSAAYAALGWPAPGNQGFPERVSVANLDLACFDTYADCTALIEACSEGQCCAETTAACGADGSLTEAEVQRGIGVFHGISEKGFRGLDFQARLFFESRFGSCEKPVGVAADAIDDLVARGADASTGDVVLSLKERLTHDTTFDAAEQELVAALVGPVDGRAGDVDGLDQKLRTLCGALLASPQFQLTGIAGPTSSPAPLQPSRAAICAEGLPGCG